MFGVQVRQSADRLDRGLLYLPEGHSVGEVDPSPGTKNSFSTKVFLRGWNMHRTENHENIPRKHKKQQQQDHGG
jgi:hypothetical protein